VFKVVSDVLSVRKACEPAAVAVDRL
jgi:hypothetical protein